MSIDLVHDIQEIYRKVLHCMSRPGIIESISEQSKQIDFDVECFDSTYIMMFMLLDAEVSFSIISKHAAELTTLITQLTLAKAKSINDADFIFILEDAAESARKQAFQEAKLGDFIDPHESATIVIEAEKISDDPVLQLSGPGIEHMHFVNIEAAGNWMEERAKKNKEYPLGVDVILIDQQANLVCLPRTTTVMEQVVN